MYNCRECENEINQATEICPHCGADLTMSVAGSQPATKPSLQKILLRWGFLLAVFFAAFGGFFGLSLRRVRATPTPRPKRGPSNSRLKVDPRSPTTVPAQQ